LSGALHINASLRGDLEHGGLDVQAHGDTLKIGTRLALASLDARINVAPATATTATAASAATQFGERTLQVELSATGLVAQKGTFPRARIVVDGTVAQHKATLAFAGEGSRHRSFRAWRRSAKRATPRVDTAWTWTGVVDSLENRGPWAMKLEAPATLEVAKDRVQIGEARLRVADGNRPNRRVQVGRRSHFDARTFSGVPVVTVAKLAAVKLPFDSTVTLGGEWSLAATPRLNGTVIVRREQGDFAFASDTGLANRRFARFG
jgi:translocation and assembly module TamB